MEQCCLPNVRQNCNVSQYWLEGNRYIPDSLIGEEDWGSITSVILDTADGSGIDWSETLTFHINVSLPLLLLSIFCVSKNLKRQATHTRMRVNLLVIDTAFATEAFKHDNDKLESTQNLLFAIWSSSIKIMSRRLCISHDNPFFLGFDLTNIFAANKSNHFTLPANWLNNNENN